MSVEFPTDLRIQVARQMVTVRRVLHNTRSSEFGMAVSRDLQDLNEIHGGLFGFLNAVSQIDPRKLVDIGTGTGKGAKEIQNQFSQLKVLATDILTQDPTLEETIPLTLTSAEKMRGFKNESVSGILSTHSIDYSPAQEVIAQRFDEILVPGGIIQAVFHFKTMESLIHGIKIRDSQKFGAALQDMRYDVFIITINKRHQYEKIQLDFPYSQVVVAIKQGNPNGITAEGIVQENIRLLKQNYGLNIHVDGSNIFYINNS